MDLDKLRDHYNTHRHWLTDDVANQLMSILRDATRTFEKQNLNIAPPKPPTCRTKDFHSIIAKMKRLDLNWKESGLFTVGLQGHVTLACRDIVGGRIVCATSRDVQEIVNILKQSDCLIDSQIEDKHVRDTGYRAYHIDALVEVPLEGRKIRFPVEIQVKTLLQDAWSNFGHSEYYKPDEDPPEVSREISVYLADVLHGIDKIGQAIRDERLRKKRIPQFIDANDTFVNKRTLRHLVDDKLGAPTNGEMGALNNDQIERCVDQLRAYGYDSIADVGGLWDDKKVSNTIRVAMIDLGIQSAVGPFERLYFGPVAAKDDRNVLAQRLQEYYGYTKHKCTECSTGITEEQEKTIDRDSDLDGSYLCCECAVAMLRQCQSCGTMTRTDPCKNCLAKLDASQII